MSALPQVCPFCERSLADPDVPDGEPKDLFSLAIEVSYWGERALACPYCRKVLSVL